MSDQQTTIETVSAYAIQKGAPFTSREVFDNCDTCDEIQPIYAAVNQLFTRGLIKRRKLVSKPGYEFIWHEVEIDGFDNSSQVVLNDSTESILGAAASKPPDELKPQKPKQTKPEPKQTKPEPEQPAAIPQFVETKVKQPAPAITYQAASPSWWICRDGSLRIETGDRLVCMDLGSNDAADLADMIVAVHEALGIR